MEKNDAVVRQTFTFEQSLVERCIDLDFSMKIHDIEYCRLGINPLRIVDCPYLADKVDHNGLKPCLLTVYFNTKNPVGGDYIMGKRKG